MPWTQINLGDQHSQEMTIKYVRDNYLVCTMSGFDSSYAMNAVSTDVSRPAGLRRMDYDGSGAYSYHHANTRKILSGDTSGEYELVTPVYNTGEKIYVTKMVSSPMDTSGNSFTTDLLPNSTVDIFIDENRAGRNWAPTAAGGSGGLPSGYKPKCIVFCEDGTEISGQILFKSGCDDTDEGVSQAAATLEAGVISAATGFDTNLYYGPKSTDTYDNNEGGTPALSIYDGVGQGIKGFTGQPIDDKAHFDASKAEGYDATEAHATPGLAKDYLYAAFETPFDINNDQSKNYAVINLPSGTKASSVRIGECAYTIPEVGEKVAAKGENTFAVGTYYYFIANTPTAGCFGCGTYWAGIKGDGTTSGEVTATGHVLPSVKGSETELATIGDDVWYYNRDNVKTGIFADLAVYNKSLSTFSINLDSATIGATGISPNLYGENGDEPVIRVPVGDSAPYTTVCERFDGTSQLNEMPSDRFYLYVSSESPAQSGAKILMGTDYKGNGLYSFVPFVGSTFLLGVTPIIDDGEGTNGVLPKGLHSNFPSLSTDTSGPISGLEAYTDNKYFVYTAVDKTEPFSPGRGVWEYEIEQAVLSPGTANLAGFGKKIYLKLNHTAGTPSAPLGLTGGGFAMDSAKAVDAGTKAPFPGGEFVKVVATGFCD